VKVKYAEAEDKKEVKITRLNSVSLEDRTVTELSQLSDIFVRGENTQQIIFAYTYKYLLFDQYRKYIIRSEYGGAKPMIKESFGKLFCPYPKYRAFIDASLKKYSAKPWSGQEHYCYLDRVVFPAEEEYFRPKKNGEFYHTIRDGRLVFDLLGHVWHGSVNEKHVVDLTNNKMHSEFINVKEDFVGWWIFKHKEVISFQIMTTYTVKTN
ncbi:MAG TPA: hypothetical protein PLJ44_11870, partial [Victivallales bacterium]|nr:hypothetical protein [Victivallales bacterium]